VLFVLIKISKGYWPIVLLSAKVVAFGFHVSFEENFG
jgi:hypothetical protein